MKAKSAAAGEGSFEVIGVGLTHENSGALLEAFPRAFIHTPLVESWDEASDLCDRLGRVVLFNFLPCMQPHLWVRASAIFHHGLVRVIGLHPQCDESVYDLALGVEFDGVLEVDASPASYRRAAYSVQRGELWFPRDYLSRRARESVVRDSSGSLSERESEVLTLLAAGANNQSIADALNVTRDTVRWRLRSIYSKIGVSDRAAASRLARNIHQQRSADGRGAELVRGG